MVFVDTESAHLICIPSETQATGLSLLGKFLPLSKERNIHNSWNTKSFPDLIVFVGHCAWRKGHFTELDFEQDCSSQDISLRLMILLVVMIAKKSNIYLTFKYVSCSGKILNSLTALWDGVISNIESWLPKKSCRSLILYCWVKRGTEILNNALTQVISLILNPLHFRPSVI